MFYLKCLTILVLLGIAVPSYSEEPPVVTLLRAQALNKIFDGFDYYYVTIESDLAQADGTREVTAVASGKFLDQTKQIKVLVLVVDDIVIGGQVLDEKGLPLCVLSNLAREESL